MEELGKYLTYGDTLPIKKSVVVETIDYNWDEAKELFREKLTNSLSTNHSSHLAFSGTTAGLTLRHILGHDVIKTLWTHECLNIDPLLEGWQSKYGSFDVSNLENDLIKLAELSDVPRCSMEDIFSYHRIGDIGKESDTLYCEGGTDFLFLGFNVVDFMMKSLFRRKQYDIAFAMKISNGKSQLNGIGKHRSEISNQIFNDDFFYFTNDEIERFGLQPPKNIIDPSTQATFMTSFFDLGYHIVYEMRTKLLGNHFGVDIFSPFYNDPDFVKFCLSIPMEMKYCIGRKKHILKEAFDLSKQYKKFPHFDLERTLFAYIKDEIRSLSIKYLTNKKSKIFNYLPFDIVQKYIEPKNKKTIVLLNLAIWMEVHKC